MIPDGELLRQYAKTGDEAAFAELVRRHLPLVYGAALRLLAGDAHLAQDVAQGVFTDLANKAGELRGHPTLVGWLHISTRFQASKAVRTEQRRRAREQEAAAMNETLTTPEIPWEQLQPLLDEAIAQLPEDDRDAVLLRYFEDKSYAEVGEILGLEPSAAHKRVSRAVDKMREHFARSGITASAALLSTTLSSQGTTTLPEGLAATVTGAAVAGAAALKASSVAATAAKGAAIAGKATGLAGLLGVLLGPLLGLVSGLLGMQSGLRQAFPSTKSNTTTLTDEGPQPATREEWQARRQEWREKIAIRRQAQREEIKRLLEGWRVLLIKPYVICITMMGVLLAFGLEMPDKKGEKPLWDEHWTLVGVVLFILIGLTIWTGYGVFKATRAFNKSYRDPYRKRNPNYLRRFFVGVIMGVAFCMFINLPLQYVKSNPALATSIAVGFVFGLGLLFRGLRKMAKWASPDFPDPPLRKPRVAKEFRSLETFLGWPLVHVNFVPTVDGKRPMARGWIAIGSRAVGVVAIGGTAVGVVSIGPAAVGLVAFGGIALAPIALGCLAIGHWAAGGIAVGTFATGGVAFGIQAASGAFAEARNFASGDLAYAAHANDTAAQTFVAGTGFFTRIHNILHEIWVAVGYLALFFVGVVIYVLVTNARTAKRTVPGSPDQPTDAENKPRPFSLRTATVGLVISTAGAFGVLYLWDRLAEDPAFPIPIPLVGFLLCLFLLMGALSFIFLAAVIANTSWSEKLKSEKKDELDAVAASSAPNEGGVSSPPLGAENNSAKKPGTKYSKKVLLLILTVVVLIASALFVPAIHDSDLWSGVVIAAAVVGMFATDIIEACEKIAGSKKKAALKAMAKTGASLAKWILLYTVTEAYWHTALIVFAVVLAAMRLGLVARLGLDSKAWWKFALGTTSSASIIMVFAAPNTHISEHPSILVAVLAAGLGHRLLFMDKYEKIEEKTEATTIEV